MTNPTSILIFGATGMLGQSVLAAAARRGVPHWGCARNGAGLAVDLADTTAVEAALLKVRPAVIINCAAITDLTLCEADPGLAYRVNARAVAMMAEAANRQGSRLVHISTDHYFTGDGAAKHAEDAPVTLLNEYARSKYAGEAFAATARNSLILRTSVTGYRGWSGKPTFIEWALDVIHRQLPVSLFDDFYTSTIDAASLAEFILELAYRHDVSGLLNLACRDVVSKAEFLRRFAKAQGRSLDHATRGSVSSLVPRRAESLGLDVARAEALLGRALPGVDDVINSLVSQQEAKNAI